jgi:hypothetical protein
LTLFKNFPGGNMRYSGASAPTQDAVISYDRPSGAQTRHTPYRTPLLDVDAVTEQILSFSPQVVLIGAGTQCTRIGARYWAAWEAERVMA